MKNKFRAWNKKIVHPRMEYSNFIIYPQTGLCGCTWDTSGHTEKTEDFILMQCIGIKDINGIWIYEGDIVTENLYWDTQKNDIVYFKVIFINNGFKIKDKKNMIFEIGVNPTIVGNIYENPELKLS